MTLIHGFQLIKTEELPDISAVAHYYHHERSGGEVVWLETADLNRTFGIGFKTPPLDSTGAAHIVEHTVLSGSRKYPVKDPFMQMVKASMSTFLNAMTFSDMTCFPVASMNEEDFHHLMDVYLDAVFFPNVLKDERIFKQEGWHKELLDSKETMRYNGIVYNEMRGEYGDTDRQVSRQIQQYAHPESTYANESGGYPYDIPTLTYQDFLAFYKRYYRPDNALVGLYGDIDINRALEQIDGEFFSHFEDSHQIITMQTPAWPLGDQKATTYYNGDDQQTAATDSYLSYTVPFGTCETLIDQYRLGILLTALIESEAGALQEALVEAGYAEDLYVQGNNGYYLDFSFVVERMNAMQRDEIVQIIEKTFESVAREGVNRELLVAVADASELMIRKLGGANRGLTLFIQMMSGWRYRNNPTDGMHFQKLFKQLREDIESGAFDRWVREKLVQAKARVILLHEPKTGLFSQKDQEVSATLAEEQAAMSEGEVAALISENQALQIYQQTPDTPAAVHTLPQLKLTDIERQVTVFDEVRQALPMNGTLLYHPQPTNGVRYVTITLALNHLKNADLPYVSDLCHLLGTLNTAHHSYQKLEIAVAGVTNGIQMRPKVYATKKAKGDVRLVLSFNALKHNTQKAFSLLEEVLFTSQWEDIERIKLVIKQLKTGIEEEVDAAGNRVALDRLQAGLATNGYYRELLGGVTYYDHVSALLEALEQEPESVIARWKKVLHRVLSSDEPVVSLTGEAKDQTAFVSEARAFIAKLPLAQQEYHLSEETLSLTSEALSARSNVQYVAMGNRLPNWQEHGKWRVLTNLMSNEILYDQIRLQGGAYGEGMFITVDGLALAYSYRDPHVDRTIHAFQHMAQSLKETQYNDQDLKRLIIGTLTSYQFPLPPQQVDGLALNRYFRQTTEEMLLERLDETMQTTTKDLADYTALLHDFANEPKVVVYGNQDKLAAATYPFACKRAFKR
ncbi:MAG: insulinase family protein [Aerococcus sp.]|nr:insulinase family protein [Aerococcus sp.]